MVLRLRGNIAVREGGIGGTCYTQRDKVSFYWNNVDAGHAALGFANMVLEKVTLR